MSDARAERRRRDRDARKRTTTRLVGDGIVAHTLGHHYRAEGGAELPAKVPGKHRWIATAAYVLDDLEAATAYDDDAQHMLGPDRLMYLAIGCWDCEQLILKAGADSPCPAPAN